MDKITFLKRTARTLAILGLVTFLILTLKWYILS